MRSKKKEENKNKKVTQVKQFEKKGKLFFFKKTIKFFWIQIIQSNIRNLFKFYFFFFRNKTDIKNNRKEENKSITNIFC
jgi:hypothetical protein